MTLKQKEDADRPWLRQELLVVTKELASLLASSSLSEKEKRFRALVQHIILRDSQDVTFYHNIHTVDFKNLIGNDYKQVLEWLVNNDCLQINPSYSNDPDNPFSGSYRIPSLTESNLESSITVFEFKTFRIKTYKDHSIITDSISGFVLENLRKLTVRKQLVYIEDLHRRAFALEYCKWVYHKRFNVKYGDTSRRLFHTVIRMVKESRNNLVLRTSGESLLYFDVTACYPNLLPYWAQGITEKKFLVSTLNRDFYGTLAEDSKTDFSRDELKRTVSIFLSDNRHPSNNVMGSWLETHCPNLFAFICSRKSMALDLQNLEAELFVEKLGGWALQHRKWFVPMHDGFLCQASDGAAFEQQAESIFESVVGHKPLLKQSVLAP